MLPKKSAVADVELTLPVIYIRQIGEQLRCMGIGVEQWLKLSRLSETDLANPAFSVDLAVFRRLLLDALALSQEPALGLFVGERLVASTHGILGYAALTSGTIRQALQITERFTSLRISLLSLTHEVVHQQVRLCVREETPLGEIRRPLLEAVVLSVKNMLDAISMGTCQVGEAAFAFPRPSYAALARDLFRCEVRYSAGWTGFAFPLEVLDAPLKLADPEAFQQAALICQRELEKLVENKSLAARVRRLLLEKQNGFPSLQTTARTFHMTQRTLHRRLLDEGTSFRKLLEDVRHLLAVEHLRSGRFSIEEIAYTLGYSDLANFRRAFKRWENVAPSQYEASQSANLSRAAPE